MRRALVPVQVAGLAGIAAGTWSGAAIRRLPVPLAAAPTAWHALDVDDVLRELGTTTDGLSHDDAESRRAASTETAHEARQGMLRATLSELDNPLTPPLATGAGVSAAVGAVTDAALIGLVMAGNALVGGAQRVSARRALRDLEKDNEAPVRLRRSGEEQRRSPDEVVPGDVLLLQAGDVVPADCRIVTARGLEVDESSLTGESLPVVKGPAASIAAAVADRTSMLFAGTSVAAGSCVAVVVATGRRTELGRSQSHAAVDPARGGIHARLQQLTNASVPVALSAAGTMLGVGALRGTSTSSVASAVSLAVAAVPEGLPFAATMAQLAAAKRLSSRGALVRDPRTMEALGRVDVLCFDKTGTLTEGRIRLRRVSDGLQDEPVERLSPARRAVLAAALRASPNDDGRTELPHPTDRAVVAGRAFAAAGSDDAGWVAVDELPFEPARGYHAVLSRRGDRHVISVKGAPEVVLPRCSRWTTPSRPTLLDAAARAHLVAEVERLARTGHRVLAVAERESSPDAVLDDERVDALDFAGLLALADPVRPSAAAAIRDLREAGVRVVMVTGDHPSTAEAIASELGLLDGGRVLTGAELDQMNEATLDASLPDVTVFARVAPTQKVAVVRSMRRIGKVVAMTGDGANDAPAIRLADVGVALGDRSTTAARDAADVVVVDGRVETIIDAIVEGRAMWASVREAVAILLGGNLGEIAFTVGSTLLSPQPVLNARQLLLVNLLTDLLPSMALAVRRPRHATPSRLLDEGPEASLGSALSHEVAVRASSTFAATTAGWIAARATGTVGRASTVALASLVGAQLAQTLVAAHGDLLVTSSVLASGAALVGVVQNPAVGWFFGCRPLGPVGWGIAGAASGGAAVLGVASRRSRPPHVD